MDRRIAAWILVMSSVVAVVSCGDDDSDEGDQPKGTNTPVAGASGTAAGGAGKSGGPAATSSAGSSSPGGLTTNPGQIATLQCGSATCVSSPFGGSAACCADEGAGACGTMQGSECVKAAADDPRCPGINFMGFLMLPSCCDPKGLCGIDTSSVGMPGCIDLASAAERAQSMGGGSGIIEFPTPRRCDGEAPDATDAGTDDAGA